MGRRRRATDLDGILLIDKEPAWTSHDVVAKLRGITGQPRIGHTGTLDPAATGLLVVCFGQATRLVEYMTVHDKSYTGEVVLGVTTDTDDAAGSELARAPVPALDDAGLRRLEARFTGTIEQVPPAFSAVQVGGERAYAAARAGRPHAIAPRPVRVDRLRLTPTAPDRLTLTLDCGPGTYVRSLARDIGAELGCGAHLAALRRTRVDRFLVEEAATIGDLAEVVQAGLLDALLLPPDDGITAIEAALVDEDTEQRLRWGQDAPVVALASPPGDLRVYGTGGAFVGMAALTLAGLKALKIFRPDG